jgi:protocatechuate 3,4-dioxygenase beta subunit
MEFAMDSDDTPVGRLLNRREVLALLGASGAMLATGASFGDPRPRPGARSVPACVVRPAQTEGPYFVDEGLTRSDIRSDPASGAVHAGTLLSLWFLVSRVGSGGCQPLPGAVVDVWQCNAEGIYSDVDDPHFSTKGQRFLRGNQKTDHEGRATFRTIYPGWYPGRTVHIHFKLRTPPGAGPAAEFTSQVYFDDALTDRVHAAPPYSGRGQGRTRNAADRIFRSGGDQLLLAPRAVADGYEATFAVGLQLG